METTDQKKIILTWAKVLPMVAGLLLGTNTVTGLIFNQERNTEDIKYNMERADRKDKAQMEKTKQLLYISELKAEILHLQHELKEYE